MPADPATAATPMPVRVRLGAMMFLQYFVQGCYLPIISLYLQDSLKFTPQEVGLFSSALAVGPLLAPFIVGQLVDRHLATERVLSFCHLAGGVIMLSLFTQRAFWPVILLGTLYSTLYVPSMMLTNSLAFAHLADRSREFPGIRLWGTIGFVMPAWFVEYYYLAGLSGEALNAARGILLAISGGAGLVMGAYALSLPHTPPKRDVAEMAPKKVVALVRLRPFLVLVLASFLIAIVHQFFFVWNSPFLRAILDQAEITGAYEGRIASLGQIFEVAVMAGLGLLIKRLGFKRTLALGGLAYTLRTVFFALAVSMGEPFALKMALVAVGEAMHGACFGCFLAVAFIYVDRNTTPDVRGSAQNIYGTFVVGAGFFAGGAFAGLVGKWFTTPADARPLRSLLGIESQAGLVRFLDESGAAPIEMLRDWPGIWLTSTLVAGATLAMFLICFPAADSGEGADRQSPPG